jgi:hypothetical protein
MTILLTTAYEYGMTKPRKAPKGTEGHRNPPKGTERHQNPPKGTTITDNLTHFEPFYYIKHISHVHYTDKIYMLKPI